MRPVPEKYPHTTLYIINDLVDFHPGNRTLTNRTTEKSVILQNPASFILVHLLNHCGVVIPQRRLVEIGWGEKNNITSVNTLYQTVLTLRKALSEVGLPRDLIKTVARRGMVLVADIQRAEMEPENERGNEAVGREEVVRTPWKARSLRATLIAGTVLLSVLLVSLWTSYGLFYPPAESLFSSYTILDATSISSCTLFLKGQGTLDTRYVEFMDRHKEICHNHNYVYLSGMNSADNIAAVACQMDIRKNPSTKCTTWYSINNEN